MIQLSQACQVVDGVLRGADVLFHNVSINTRDVCEGRLFVALKGEQFDAHDYVAQAATAGAVALLVEQDVSSVLPVVKVDSTHQALKDLAAWWRTQLVLPVIGITGSVGKTTVKEMAGAIFSQLGQGVVTHGNLNNEIGVPLTLMRLSENDRFAIVEMGMNHAGEIQRLTQVAQPTIALITNAGEAHLEHLGSVAAVAKAKGEIFAGLTPDGTAVINADDAFASEWQQSTAGRRVVSFGLTNAADITATYRQHRGALEIQISTPDATFEIRLKALGEHSVRNALAATALAIAANVPIDYIQRGLAEYRSPAGRLQVSQIGENTLIDDTYNANPTSMAAAVEVLAGFAQSTLIVGDMAELGEHAESAHRQLGVLARANGIDKVLACGRYAELVVNEFGADGHCFVTQAELIEFVLSAPLSGAILVKGSRSAAMENVVRALGQYFDGSQTSNNTKKHGEGAC
ncbi:UDP-N-acetylmuramoyl-tripeptide--D-alanyl-D-alanine ligase [Arenicella xantha]|uniref:UDP-N-acetylmuramoyl-tripeptide--D-alanyl-D-alanine ligase n=1 Tax=Arenicella xantha TaxID=644221 RepID=A0A395JLG6_9GAMM|nr:UDP-N-acetylmuramoyl-tripeptide--D-alanyl-D-alanine ligase [Arenicella xantha]RBP49862.1 UDP-N-acetylmuramoyl-tripeptide--D-alanyl-D-alanine ligase [Arenicella xantha]